ncbi:neutral sphingomyelinase activation associated factor-like BEACH domain containing [Cryptosporidium sp. chipmunk genotype I]|uniref:neutral sphingomyelinase activation associated factor-like BEACH domain containing n=1 Tax=Cryptosporidium sp. chipmunk genotype I TaxID=1280935 RepID=UPI00351AA6E9|nr:neutral sphingomyelinase activation associated factor-like BEACH domain containing [Cryptosporidium sp. chipmunk genotype I]
MALKGVRQFSHLTLEENEEYITDVPCIFKALGIQIRTFGNIFKGRIRIGSKSIIIEPDDSTISMVKILFSQITEIKLEIANSKMMIFTKVVRLVDVQLIDGKSRSVTPNQVLSYRDSRGLESSRDSFEFEITITSEIAQHLMNLSNDLWMEHSKKHGSLNKLEDLVGKWISFLYNKEILNVEYEFLLDHRDQFLISKPLIVNRIKPFTKHRGILHIVSSGICFKPLPNFSNKPYKRIPLKNIWFIFKRIYSMKPNSVEIIYGKEFKSHIMTGKGRTHWRSLFLEFQSTQDREHIVAFLQSYLMSLNSKGCQWSSQAPQYASCQCSSLNASSCLPMLFVDPLYASQSPCFKNHIQNLWKNGSISTYHYLDYLNSISGRSKGDLTQYPIFPWTIVSFNSVLNSKYDLSQSINYRDLSKPLGSINTNNLEMLKSRMKDLPISEQFLYGSHYSTPGYISYFLVRQFPEYQLKLHGGDFDVWNRMFHSMNDTWRTILEGKTTYMELIPQFYEQNPEFLLNNKLNIRTNSGSLLNVQIPKWELETDQNQLNTIPLNTPNLSQAEKFLRTMRYALEGQVVSQHIHEWIDLIFGFKQRGPQAYISDNLFHPITYINSSIAMLNDKSPIYAVQECTNEGTSYIQQEIYSKKSFDENEDIALKAQVEEFGQVPIMLFNDPHPKRNAKSLEDSTIMQHLNHECANMPWFVLFKSNPQLLEAKYDFNQKLDQQKHEENHLEKSTDISSPLVDLQIHLKTVKVLNSELSNTTNRMDISKRDLVSQENILRSNYKLGKDEFDNKEKFTLDEKNGFMLIFTEDYCYSRSGFQKLDLSKISQLQDTARSKTAQSFCLTSIYERPGEFVLLALLDQFEERLLFYISMYGCEELGFKCVHSSKQDLFGNKALCIDLLVCDEGSAYVTIGTLSGDLICLRFKLSSKASSFNLTNSEYSDFNSMFVMAQKEKALKQFNMGDVSLLLSIEFHQSNCYIVAVSQGGTMLVSKHSIDKCQDFRKSTWFPIVDIPLRYEKVASIIQMDLVNPEFPSLSKDKLENYKNQRISSANISRFGKITKDIDSSGFCFSCILSDLDGKKQRLWSFGGQDKLLSLDLIGMLKSVFSAQGVNRKENGGSGSNNFSNDIITTESGSGNPQSFGLKEIEESQKVEWIFLKEKSLVLYVGFNRFGNLTILVFWDIRKKEDAKVHKIIFIPNLFTDSVCWDKYRKGLLILGRQTSDTDLRFELQLEENTNPSLSVKNEERNIYFLQERHWTSKNNNTLQILTLKSSFELLLNMNTWRTSFSDHNSPDFKRPSITCTEKLIMLSSYLAFLVFKISKKNQTIENLE